MDCYTGDGRNYIGHVNKTADGTDCQAWAMQLPHGHKFNDDQLPDKSLEKAKNYCRNPKPLMGPYTAKAPWCFTVNNASKTGICNIEKCGK